MKRAIIIDDENSIRDIVGKTLSRVGYTIIPYSSPSEATIFNHPEKCPLATVNMEPFDTNPMCADLIVTDICMPKISGIEFVRKLRQVGCRVHYIAIMSGMWSESDIREAEKLRCKVFIKPFELKEFRDWVISLEY
jgi:CheY-like chemotaxis protein